MELINVKELSSAWTVNKKKFKKHSRLLKQTCIVLNQTGDRLDYVARQPKSFKQGFLILQLFLDKGKPFSAELKLAGALNSRKTLVFSTEASSFYTDSVYVRATGQWTNVCIDLASYAPLLPGFCGLAALTLHAHCRIARVFFVRSLSNQHTDWPTQVFARSADTQPVLARFSSTRVLPKIDSTALRRASVTFPELQHEISESIHVSDDDSARETAGSSEKTVFTLACTPRQLSLPAFKPPSFYENAVRRLTQVHCQSPVLTKAS